MNDVVEHLSPAGFEATVERLTGAIAQAGLRLFAAIDHAAGAREVGLAMPPATVLIYGHPRGGTPVMLTAPETALDLPLRVLVRERDDGQVVIAFRPVAAALRRAGVPEALSSRLEPAQQILLTAMAS